jgi:protein gp37
MSENTKIQWCDYSWSPWEGCTKVSPGCLNCYAEERDKRHLIEPVDHWGKGAPRRRTSESYWEQPIRWNAIASPSVCSGCGKTNPSESWLRFPCGEICCSETCWMEAYPKLPLELKQSYRRPRVFPSLCDPFDDEVPIEWLVDFLALIRSTPNLDYLLLTKRPESWRKRLSAIGGAYDFGVGCLSEDWLYGNPPQNIWIGVSVEDQRRADERIPKLLEIPAKVRFLSAEPLLGPIDLTKADYFRDARTEPAGGWFGSKLSAIDWVIIGGESGRGARPCHVGWIASLILQCKEAGVAVFLKQLGANVIGPHSDGVGLKLAIWKLRHPKGGDPSEWPKDYRVREFPKTCHSASLDQA